MKYVKFSSLILSTQYGYTADNTFMNDGVYKYLRITDIVPYFIDKDSVPYCEISDIKAKQYLVNENDLLIARTGATTGYNLLVPKGYDNYIFASYLVRYFYDKKQIYPLYLKHVLKSAQWYGFVNNYIGGSAQPGINPKTFGRFQFPLTDYYNQQMIANVLEAYDATIENNNRRIQLLEQIIEELYKEWFVRFRYPGYKSNKTKEGIPLGWNIKHLRDFGRIETGKTPSTTNLNNYGGEILFVKTPDMHNKLFVIDTEEKLTKLGHKTQPRKLLPKNSIMVSCIGTAGVVSINSQVAHTNQQINSIVLDNDKYLEWMYFCCKSLKETIKLYGATGATMTNLSKGKFENLKILQPNEELIFKFHERAKPIFEQIKLLMIQNNNLKKQRDSLIPRLISGKLKVK